MGILEQIEEQNTKILTNMSEILQRLNDLDGVLFCKDDRLLGTREIMAMLAIKNRNAFERRITHLFNYGMFKDGHYKMYESDLQKYIDDLKGVTHNLGKRERGNALQTAEGSLLTQGRRRSRA